MSNHDIELPPLTELPTYSPEVFDREVKVVSETMIEQLMQDYARAAIEADRQQRGEALSALAALVNVLRERHYGRMPDEVQVAYDRAWSIVYTIPQSATSAQEPRIPDGFRLVNENSLTVPEGWQLVPIELTEGMHIALRKGLSQTIFFSISGIYAALLEAAPTYSDTPKRLEGMNKSELIDLIEQQQQELEAIGAGGVSGKLIR